MGVSSYQTVTLQSLSLPLRWGCVPLSLLQSCWSSPLPGWGWPKSSLLLGHLCGVIYRRPGSPNEDWGARSVFRPWVLLLKCTEWNTKCPPLPPPPPSLLSFLLTHLSLCSQTSPALSRQGPHFHLFPSSPPAPNWVRGLPLGSTGAHSLLSLPPPHAVL